MLFKSIFICICLVLLSGCATGGAKYVDSHDGSILMDTAAHTGLATQGATMTRFYKCNKDHSQCEPEPIGEHIGANPTLLEQLAGPAAMVGSAKLIGDGLGDSGDEVNNVNQQAQGQFQKQRQHQRQMNGMQGWSVD